MTIYPSSWPEFDSRAVGLLIFIPNTSLTCFLSLPTYLNGKHFNLYFLNIKKILKLYNLMEKLSPDIHCNKYHQKIDFECVSRGVAVIVLVS